MAPARMKYNQNYHASIFILMICKLTSGFTPSYHELCLELDLDTKLTTM